MYKKCSKCKEEKSFDEFHIDKTKKDGHRTSCKACIKKYSLENKDRSRKRYIENKTIILEYKKYYGKIYRDSNKILISKRLKKYRENNKSKFSSYTAKRRASKLQATPKWLTVEDLRNIQELYEIAQAFKLYTGQDYHIDHIIPLQGETVCGLHVPWNLQILEASENIRKSNKLLEN